jgi:hypothetical protein
VKTFFSPKEISGGAFRGVGCRKEVSKDTGSKERPARGDFRPHSKVRSGDEGVGAMVR